MANNINDVILSNWGKVEVPFVSYYGTISTAVGEWYKNFGNALFAKMMILRCLL